MPDRQHLISAFCNSRYKKAILFLLYGVMLCAFASGAPLYAASVYTDRPDYPPGDSVAITANGFWNNENVTVQVTHLDGTPTDGEGHDPWQVIANALGNFETFWNIPYDDNLLETLLVTAIGQSSGLLAMTTFADCNSNLYFTANIPDTLCPGQSYNACARLVEVCKKGNYAPLPNRPIIFYLNPGNCGVNQGQNGFDTIWTDANGIACVTVPVPSTPGEYSLRAKYLGESKPAYGQPGNSACQPGTRLEISASNVCERFIVNSASCNRPPVATCPGNTSVFLCGLGPVCTSGFSYSDPDGDPVSVTVSLGTLTGNTVCFTPSGEGNYTIRLIATDSHGLADTCETVVTVNLNDSPVANCPGNLSKFVCDLSPITIPGFTWSDPNNNIKTITAVGGTLSGNSIVFTPVVGANTLKLIVTDSCNVADTCQTVVTVALNAPPDAVCPGNQSKFVCDLSPITIPGFSWSDPNNNVKTITAVGGSLSGNSIVFTPVVGANTLKLIVTDSCNVADTCQTVVTVALNAAPDAVCPGNQSKFVCDLSPITIPGFSWSDPNSNIKTITAVGGTLSGNSIVFTPVVGANTLKLIVTDSCNVADTCQTVVTVTLNSKPVASCPGNQSKFVCDLSPITIPGFTWSDPNNNVKTITAVGGTLSGNSIIFTPVVGANTLKLIVTDSCNVADTCQTVVTVTLNSKPVASCPGNQSKFVCDLSPITIPGFTWSDPNNNVKTIAAVGGTLSGNSIIFTPVVGANTLKLIVTDSCNVADTCQTVVTVTLNSKPVASCPGNQSKFVCDLSPITIPGFSWSDPNNNIKTIAAVGGTLSGNSIVFTPVVGANTLKLIVTDSCNVADTCQTVVTVSLNGKPVASCPGNQSKFVCDLSPITIPGFSWSDPNNNIKTITAVGGTLSGNSIVFTPVVGANTLKLIVTDSCNVADTCQTVVTVSLNGKPVASCPGNQSKFVCDLSPITVPGFTWSDPNNNIKTITAVGGTLSGNSIVFTPVVGANTLKLIVTDSCNVADTCQTVVTVALNSPPVANCPPNTRQDTYLFFCNLPTTCCIKGFSASDPDGNLATVTVTGGTLSGDSVCFTPAKGTNTIRLIATDSCGMADTCETVVTIVINEPPVANGPAKMKLPVNDMSVCDLSQLCIPGFSWGDPNNNIATVTVTPGTLKHDTVCFTPVAGMNTITLIVTDSCGLADTAITNVRVIQNSPPVATCPGNQSKFVCNLNPLTIDGFGWSDPDNNIASKTVIGGTLNGNLVTFTPIDGANVIKLIVTDSCGLADTCQTIIAVDLNDPPVAGCPGDFARFVCNLSPITVPGFSWSDPNNNIKTITAVGGTLSGNSIVFTPVAGANTLKLIVTDSCNAADTCQTVVTVNLNQPPVAQCHGDTTMYLFEMGQYCLRGFGASDPDGNLSSVSVIGGTKHGDSVCFTTVEGINTITLIAVDSCGLADTCVTHVRVDIIRTCPSVKIEKTHNTLQGHFIDVGVSIEYATYPIGGFDFLIAYDASALTLADVTPGDLLDTCDWEYFTYRTGAQGNCGSGCPTGLLRIVALAETNNGNVHPSCYGPSDTDPHELATMRFFVSNDRTFECQYVPVRFFWGDCGDNAFSTPDGEMLYIDRAIYDFEGNLIWDETNDAQYPENARIPFVGAPDDCLNPDPEKPSAVRCIDFFNGGVDIVCADSIDARGDINLNNLPNEIGDAVVLTNYFIAGLAAFTVNVEGQIAASDVNADGVALSVADLVYLVRVITGDALPLEKLSPYSTTVDFRSNGSVVSVDAELGAAYLIFLGDVRISLADGAAGMDIKTGFDGFNTRVLIYSFTKGLTFTGDILNVDGKLISVEAADYFGNVCRIGTLPRAFSVSSYPNPFNPTATIEMTLPQASEWTVTIFNVSGQQVAGFAGFGEAGKVIVTWDASAQASGVYFYKAEAGRFSATRKMVLLK